MGKRHLGRVDLSETRSPFTIHLPGKGSFNIKRGGPRVAEGMRKDLRGPARAHGDYFLAQPAVRFLKGKRAKDVRKMMSDLGVDVVGTVPNNAYLLRAKGNRARQQLLTSTDFQFVGAYHPAYKVDHRVGVQRLLSPERASSSTLNLVVRLHKGEPSGRVKEDIARLGGKVVHEQKYNHRTILAVDIERKKLFKLAKLDPIYMIQERPDLTNKMWNTSAQVEIGRFLDPVVQGSWVRPFHNLGIDGGGVYAEDPNVIAGCGPFDPDTGAVDPNCFVVQPQFLGAVDNGISLDAAPLAHSRTAACIGGGSCTTGPVISGVGETHRKVEMYVRSSDLNNDTTDEDATAEGDHLSCDAVTSGATTHGHIVATSMLGNATGGTFGLGFTWDDTYVANQFFSFFSDTHEVGIPADGQASGARLLFIDARGSGASIGGPPPCATKYLSDVNPGVAVIDDVQALAYRFDLNGLGATTLDPRGAKVIVLPFGSPIGLGEHFDDNVFNGHNTYAGDASDLDHFLFNNRRVFIAVPGGNDGHWGQDDLSDRDPFVDFLDPNVGFSELDVQIQNMASGKNTAVVGSNNTSTIDRSQQKTDATEYINNFSSKGPSTVASLRMAPTFIAPGFGQGTGGSGFEGSWSASYGTSHMTLQSFDDDQDDSEGIGVARHHDNGGTSFSAAKIAGAAAQIREYFAEGYYANGEQDLGSGVTDVSGALVKAVMAASTDFANSGPLIQSCNARPCIEQGWGKVELANALPLLTYQDTRRPVDASNQATDPTVPANVFVVDELWAGVTDPNGNPTADSFGVISPGQQKEYEFDRYHGGTELRAALAWYDAEGETLVNDLDLEVLDGDFDRSARWDVWYPDGPNDPHGGVTGHGACNNTHWGGFPQDCGHCAIADLANPDAAYFDPTNSNPYVRRLIGNMMRAGGQFSTFAQCGPGGCDLAPTLDDGICDLAATLGDGVCDPNSLLCSAGDPNLIGTSCSDGDPNTPAPVDALCDSANPTYEQCTAGDPNLIGDPNFVCSANGECDSANPTFEKCVSGGDIGASCTDNAGCSTGLDPNASTSQRDTDNTVEMVHVYHYQTMSQFGNIGRASSEGYYKAVVSWTNTTGNEVGAPDVPCVVPASGSGTLAGSYPAPDPNNNDHVLVTSDGMEYVASGTDDPNTVGTDEAQCDTTAGGGDLQVVASGEIAQPFALVVAGAISLEGESASTVSLNQETYDCSDNSLSLKVSESDVTTFTSHSARISNGSYVEVLDENDVPVDLEEGFVFGAHGGWNGLDNYDIMTAISEDQPVQNIAALGRSPVRHNGIIEVENGWSLRATYKDPNDSTDVSTTTATIQCEPDITPGFTALPFENYHQAFIAGGCDLGRSINLRGDFNLDAGETVQYQVHFANHSGHALSGLKATLSCSNEAAATPANDPCQYLTILNPVDNIGRVPFARESAGTWNIKVDEGVTALATADRVVFFDIDFETGNTDHGGTLVSQGFRFREALHADNEILFYSTDYPTGTPLGPVFIDINLNGLVDRAELQNGGRREGREIRSYQTWVGTTNEGLLTACGGGSCVPFHFDANDGGFTSLLTADSKTHGLNPATNGWFYGTGGACGWQTQGGGPSFPKGIWHAGVGPIGNVGDGCPDYVLPSYGDDGDLDDFATFMLRSPMLRKVNTTTDARGFEYDARLENVSWNANEHMGDNAAQMIIEIDMDVYDPNNPDGEDHLPLVLGDSYSYRQFPGTVASRRGPLRDATDNAMRFGPRYDPDGIFANGDEVGIPDPLAAYGTAFVDRPLMPFPATDADGDPNNGFTSDERISDGINCPAVRVGEPCRAAGFTTPEGPVRNLLLETNASYEDFLGQSGNQFQFEFGWFLAEAVGAVTASGYGIDDVLFEWSEQHPIDQPTFAGGDCSLYNIYPADPNVLCVPDDPNNSGSGTCSGGARNGLACNPGTTSPDPNLADHEDCRNTANEGTCDTGTCTTGLIGKSCTDDNDCDLGRCVGGNTELGCFADADCDLATNDCDAIPFRISPLGASVGTSWTSRECANINFSREFTFDCTGSMLVTVTDSTPDVVSTVAGTCSTGTCTAGHVGDSCGSNAECDVRQIEINARTPAAGDPLGEYYVIDETGYGSGMFTGDISYSSLQKLPGTLYVDSNPGENVNIFVSYADPECDGDLDGETGEVAFDDIDGDGILNFGIDGVLGDQDPNRNYVTGGPISNDDSCFVASTATDVYNPANVAQMDMNLDGVIDSSDCNVNPAHNATSQCDWDNDGFGDVCDNCPRTANNNQVDTDGDGIGEVCEVTDIDGDGVINTADNCPAIYNPSQSCHQADPNNPEACARNARGELCDDAGADHDGDGHLELADNCPTELLIENPSGSGFLPYPGCSGTDFSGCYNPDQRDTDEDGIGDLCDDEDFDADGIINSLDNCVTIYNPADPTFQVQADSDGDALGDDQAGTDSVGRCANAVDPNFHGLQCTPVGTGTGCGPGGFCVQTADEYCDFNSDDDNSNGTPDDLVQFTTELVCSYAPGNFGTQQAEIATLSVAGVVLVDDGTSDFICVGGDPDPTNNRLTPEYCRDPNNPASAARDANGNFTYDPGLILTEAGPRADTWGASGTAADTACDTVGQCGTNVTDPNLGAGLRCINHNGATYGDPCDETVDPNLAVDPNNPDPNKPVDALCHVVGDGECEPVGDGIVDPGENIDVTITVGNTSVDGEGNPRTLNNVEIGIQTASPTIGCVTSGQTFVGVIPGNSALDVTGLSFIMDPNTAVSTPTQDASATFRVNIQGDDIQGNAIAQNFSIVGDSDQVNFPRVTSTCSAGALGTSHDEDGNLCEDFDTDRNFSGTPGDWNRLPLLTDTGDPLYALGDPTDDILGYSQHSGEVPFGTAGTICTADLPWPESGVDCYPVPSENDWHLHSLYEGCDDDDVYDLGDTGFDNKCLAQSDERAHSGHRSLHLGRHLDSTSTFYDTFRMRQTSAFVMDPVALGTSTQLEFWHIMRGIEDWILGIGEGDTFAGGQIHISILNSGTGLYGLWEVLSATQNGYKHKDDESYSICEMDVGDDGPLAGQLTMCGGAPQWAEQGDVYGTNLDVTGGIADCIIDSDTTTNPNGDCGETSNRTVDTSCSWVADATCGSFLEKGTTAGVGSGIWARTQFDLGPFAGRTARLRWAFEGGGGWSWGESRSMVEPEPGISPTFYYEGDTGWYVDDIKLTDIRVSAAVVIPDPVDGLQTCPDQGDTDNCGVVNIDIAGAATDARNGGLVLFAQRDNTGTPVTLDARQSVGADDPNTGGTVEGACTSGVLEFRWTDLGSGEVVKAWGPGGAAHASPALDNTYRVDARCSSDTSCMASELVEVMTYPGDGRDLTPSFIVVDDPNSADDGSQVNDDYAGLAVSDCDPNGNVTLTWRARPQTPGNDGYSVLECSSGGGACLTGTGTVNPEFAGAVVGTEPQGAVGDVISHVRACPAVGTATYWSIGHSSLAALGKCALGLDPVGGSVVMSTVPCP
jgi:hypothetical protein